MNWRRMLMKLLGRKTEPKPVNPELTAAWERLAKAQEEADRKARRKIAQIALDARRR